MLKNEKSIFDDKRIALILSLIAAVFLWSFVTLYVRPDTEGTITNVPVNFNYDSNKFTSQGLSIINQPSDTVSLKVYGDGSSIGSLGEDDYVVYPDYSAVKGTGEMKLNLLVRITNTQLNQRVKVELTGAKTSVDVVFDVMGVKELPVTTSVGDLELSDGFILNQVSCNPSVVTFSGPESVLKRISHVSADVHFEDALNETTSVETELRFLDANGTVVTMPNVEYSASTTDITVSVHQVKDIPLAIEFINTPPGFDDSLLPYALSKETLEISGPSNLVGSLNELSVGYFDLSTFELDRDYQLNVNIPDGISPLQNINTVTLSFDSANLAEKTLNIKNINVINVPGNYQIAVKNKSIDNVRLVGPKEELENLSAANVVAQVNAEDITVSVGSEAIAVSIFVPSNNHIFAIGNYSVQCDITSK